jgi:hypothetical protein
MKKSLLYLSAITFATIFSCTSGTKEKSNSSDQAQTDKLVSQNCYLSTYENDTLVLQVDKKANNKINGKLLMKLHDKPTNDGTIEGKFIGDTLFIDYTFIVGGNKTRTFKNPMAFLLKKNELTMGLGVIETTYGRSYFAKDKTINFEKSKYHFKMTDCKK